MSTRRNGVPLRAGTLGGSSAAPTGYRATDDGGGRPWRLPDPLPEWLAIEWSVYERHNKRAVLDGRRRVELIR